MSKQKVLLLGATGETGGDILAGLLEDGNFEVALLVQPSSASKPAVTALSSRGLKIVIGDLKGSVDDLAAAIIGYDIVVSAIGATNQLDQLPLVDAAAKAGIKRFVPCGFTIVCPPKDVMVLRDMKEVVYQRVWQHHLPYTIIDVGYWFQLSWFTVPSGRFDYAVLLENNQIHGGGDAKTLLTDKRDVGSFIARVLRDERTINQKVAIWGEELSQNEVVKLTEDKTSENINLQHVSAAELAAVRDQANAASSGGSTYSIATMQLSQAEYSIAKYIRQDNTLAVAKYLGYLDAKELYPDVKVRTFEAFLDELVAGEGKRPYEETLYQVIKQFTGKQ